MLLFLCFTSLSGQVNLHEFKNLTLPSSQNCERVFLPDLKSLEIDIIKQAITNSSEKALKSEDDLKLLNRVIDSNVGHFLFQQEIDGFPVYGSFVKLNITKQGRCVSVFGNLFDRNRVVKGCLKGFVVEKVNLFVSDNSLELELKPQEIWIENLKGDLEKGLLAYVKNEIDYFTLVFNNEGELYQLENRSRYRSECKSALCCSSKHKLKTPATNYQLLQADSTITVSVFLPDPLTSAEKIYGDEYSDQNDADIDVLNAERFERPVEVDFNNGSFELENEFVRITDNLSPNIEPFTTQVPVIDLNRSNDGFEDVNVYYHITKFQEHLQALGVDISDKQVRADAHSLNGADNSRFVNDANGNLYLDFGDGNVDDAEDADVIIHEYTHALSYMANSNNAGMERRSLDEALGDYFATSWSRSFSDYRWEDMFTWDGHNEFWNGRNMKTDKVYPDNLTNDIYGSSEIFSSMLMEIYEVLGRNETDRLVANLLYYLSPNMSFVDAGEELMNVDGVINNGVNKSFISQRLYERGLTENIYYKIGTDTSLCLGEPLRLGDSGWDLEGLDFTWSSENPEEDLSVFNSAEITINPTLSTVYSVQIRDNKYGRTHNYRVNVNIENCNDLEESVTLLNLQGFASGNGNLIAQFNENVEQAVISIFDLQGRKMRSLEHLSSEPLQLNFDKLYAGIYFVLVEVNDEQKVFKVMKAQ